MTFLKLATALFAFSPPTTTPSRRRKQQQQQSSRPCHVSSSRLFVEPLTIQTIPQERYDDLLDWMRCNDCVVNDKMYIDESGNGIGYGAFVRENVEEGEILFTVPRNSCVTLDDATSDPACGKAFQSIIEKAGPGGNTVVLAGYMAKEYLVSLANRDSTTKGDEGDEEEKEGKFDPYFLTLPWNRGTNCQEHILFWDDDQAESDLKGTFCYDEAMSLRSEVSLYTHMLLLLSLFVSGGSL